MLLLACVPEIPAQDSARNSVFSISTGYAWFNHGAQGGLFLSNDYIKNTHSLFTCGAKYYFAHGEGDVEGLEPKHDIHISTTALDLSGYINPFRSARHLLLIGMGFSMDYTRTSYLSNTDYIVVDNEIYTTADTDGTISLIVPVFNLYYYFNFSKNLFIGLCVNVRDFAFYQSMAGISGGVRF